nr:sporulation protein Cse60 [Limosilactobacillus mucosae]
MIKTKRFSEDFDKPHIDEQINKWIAKHPDYIIVDIKLQSHLLENDEYSSYIVRDALVIYREYENV